MPRLNHDPQDSPRARAGAGAGAGDDHAQDAHPHADAWTSPLGLPEDFVRNFYDTWNSLEEQISSYNETKKAMLANCRAIYGPYHANALKLACRLARVDPNKVAEDAVTMRQAREYLRIIQDRTNQGDAGHA